MTDDHFDAIESVLERHGLALLVERGTSVEVVGVVDDRERRVFGAVARRGRAECWEVAAELREPEGDTRAALERLWRRRLLMREGDVFMPVRELA